MWCPSQVWYLIVSIPDICLLHYFNWFGPVEQSSGAFSQYVIYALMEGAGHGAKGDMETTEENDCPSPRKEQLDIRCEIFCSCS